MTNDGVETSDTAYGWLGGSLKWKIPFGWKGSFDTTTTAMTPVGRFAEETIQEIQISPSGDFSIQKLGHIAERKINGEITVDGNSGEDVITFQ